jgi:hypothetical protein
METLMPEGLYATHAGNLTVYQSLSQLNLTFALQGFAENNPSLLNESTSDIYDAVLDR